MDLIKIPLKKLIKRQMTLRKRLRQTKSQPRRLIRQSKLQRRLTKL